MQSLLFISDLFCTSRYEYTAILIMPREEPRKKEKEATLSRCLHSSTSHSCGWHGCVQWKRSWAWITWTFSTCIPTCIIPFVDLKTSSNELEEVTNVISPSSWVIASLIALTLCKMQVQDVMKPIVLMSVWWRTRWYGLWEYSILPSM